MSDNASDKETPVARPALTEERNPARWLVVFVLMTLCLLARGTNLMALPIFGDESIYLRWAQIIRHHPWRHAFVAFIDPKPPLHFWLLALVWRWTDSPLRSGRLLSVFSAVFLVPVVVLVWRNAGRLLRQPPTLLARRDAGRYFEPPPDTQSTAYFCCITLILCPYLAFYQRMALADPIFILEMAVVVWLSLRFAAAAVDSALDSAVPANARASVRPGALGPLSDAPGADETPPTEVKTPATPAAAVPTRGTAMRSIGVNGIALGIAMALAMLTRQNISYVLWALPVAALVCLAPSRRVLVRAALPALAGLTLAAVVAGALWAPTLFVAGPHGVQTRIFYRSSFVGAQSLGQRAALFLRNARRAFLPIRVTHTAAGSRARFAWQSGWLWTYLTPPMELLAIFGVFYMAARKQWRLLGFLLFWWGITLGPVLVFGAVAYARYALAGAVPPLFIAAWTLSDFMRRIFAGGVTGRLAAILSAALLAAVFAWPMYAIGLQNDDWSRQELVPLDRHQYVTGWTGGAAARAAIAYLRSRPRRPMTVITGNGWGTPADAVWALLKSRRVHVYYTDSAGRRAILRRVPGRENRYFLRHGKYLYTPPRPTYIPLGEPIYYVSPDPIYVNNAAIPARTMLAPTNPRMRLLVHFANPPHRSGAPAQGNVDVYRLR